MFLENVKILNSKSTTRGIVSINEKQWETHNVSASSMLKIAWENDVTVTSNQVAIVDIHVVHLEYESFKTFSRTVVEV